MLNIKSLPQARQLIAFKESISKMGIRATAKHVAADGIKCHLLNLFFQDEIKVVSLLLG